MPGHRSCPVQIQHKPRNAGRPVAVPGLRQPELPRSGSIAGGRLRRSWPFYRASGAFPRGSGSHVPSDFRKPPRIQPPKSGQSSRRPLPAAGQAGQGTHRGSTRQTPPIRCAPGSAGPARPGNHHQQPGTLLGKGRHRVAPRQSASRPSMYDQGRTTRRSERIQSPKTPGSHHLGPPAFRPAQNHAGPWTREDPRYGVAAAGQIPKHQARSWTRGW